MNKEHAINVLREQDRQGKYIFTNRDISKLFPEDSFKTFNEGLKRLVKSGILKRACRDVYVMKMPGNLTVIPSNILQKHLGEASTIMSV